LGGATHPERRVNWTSWTDFFAMGGYALYVWGSYAVTAGLIVVELVLLVRRRAGILTRLGCRSDLTP
jgi:heme exporter protein D